MFIINTPLSLREVFAKHLLRACVDKAGTKNVVEANNLIWIKRS